MCMRPGYCSGTLPAKPKAGTKHGWVQTKPGIKSRKRMFCPFLRPLGTVAAGVLLINSLPQAV